MSYQEDRASAYPSVQEQLDQIFHDLKNSPNLKDGEWYKTVLKVKHDHPKE